MQRPQPLRHWLRLLHAYGGAVTALYFCVIAATGALLVFRAEVLAAIYGQNQSGDAAAIVPSIAAQHGGGMAAIAFPPRGGHPFTAYLPDHRTALHSAANGEYIPDRFGLVRAFDWVFELHHYLLAEETGMLVAGYFGLATAVLLITGPILWWPWQRGFSLNRLWPANARASVLLGAHVSLGIVLAPILLLSAVTGVSIVFHDPVKTGLNAVFGTRDPIAAAPKITSTRGSPLAKAIAAADAAFPAATVRMYIAPRGASDVAMLRLKQDDEWHPNGRTYVSYHHRTGEVLGVTDALKAGRGPAIFNALYPLHAAKMDNTAYQIFMLIVGIGGALLPYWGLRSFIKRRLKRP